MYAYKKNSIILKNNETYLESKCHLRQLWTHIWSILYSYKTYKSVISIFLLFHEKK